MNMSWSKITVLFFGIYGFILFSAAHAQAAAVVEDNFNSYNNGSLLGQGGWTDYANGQNFIVQGTVTAEGSKAVHINATADNVITKSGSSLSDGRQSVYIRTENRSNWGSLLNGNLQVRVSKGGWTGSQTAIISFKSNGNVAYYDIAASSLGPDTFTNFATYNDNEWTLLEVEWRSSDKTARYRVNSGTWTGWLTFRSASSFTDFDTVGFDFNSAGGSGGVYFDFLSNDPTLPTPVPTPTPTPLPTSTPTPAPIPSQTTGIAEDNFNSYTNGPIVGQGGWFNRANGTPWVVQDVIVKEGAKALYNNNSGADSVITKNNGGNKLANGKQSFYIRTENRSAWNTRATNFQLGIFQGSWDGPSRATLGFEKDGQVNYVNGSNDARVNFGSYIDNAWNLVEIEWRSSDASARYRINSGSWTNWIPFTGGASFTGFDTVGFVTWYLGTGGVYIDSLSSDPTLPTPIPTPIPAPSSTPVPTPTCHWWQVGCSETPPSTPTPIPPTPTATPTLAPSCTEDTWSCGDWNSCSPSGIQTRSCRRTFHCPDVETAPPATSRSCTPPEISPQPNQGENINRDQILRATVKLECPLPDGQFYKQGSGTVIDQYGTILTNRHVVAGTIDSCYVGLINNENDIPDPPTEIADVKNISQDQSENGDMVLLKIRNPNNKQFTAIDVSRGNSDNLKSGDTILPFGYPDENLFGKTITFTEGPYSGRGTSTNIGGYRLDVSGFFKTTATIDHGNSGGGAYQKTTGFFMGIPTLGTSLDPKIPSRVNYILSINSIKRWLNSLGGSYNTSTNNYNGLGSYLSNSIKIENIDRGSLRALDAPTSVEIISGKAEKKVKNQKIVVKAAETVKPLPTAQVQQQKESPSPEPTKVIQPVPAQPKSSWLKRFFLWISSRF